MLKQHPPYSNSWRSSQGRPKYYTVSYTVSIPYIKSVSSHTRDAYDKYLNKLGEEIWLADSSSFSPSCVIIPKTVKQNYIRPPPRAMAQQLLLGQGILNIEAPRSHSDTPHSVGLLWTSDQSVAETSTWQHTTLTPDKYSRPRWDSNPQSQQASGRTPTP